MRPLFLALVVAPLFVSAQDLHTFKNGEVADAEKINENFDLLMESIASGGHPEGALAFRDTDTAVSARAGGPEMRASWSQDREIQVDGQLWRVNEQSFRNRVIVNGIPFNQVGYTRLFLGSITPNLNDVCPDGSSAVLPWEAYYIFQNDVGAFAIATDWEFTENIANPGEVGPSNTTGSFFCLPGGGTFDDGRTLDWNLNLKVVGAYGRYACAAWHGGRIVSEGRGNPTTTGTITNFETSALPGGFGERMEFGYTKSTSNGVAPTGVLSIDVPEICDVASRHSSLNSAEQQLLQIFGISVDLPAIP